MSSNKYDESHWRYIQSAEEMFVLRKHDLDGDSRLLLTRWLNLDRPSLRIVEMGSGSGYFTEQLLKMTNDSSIVCVEPDDSLIEYAKKRLGEKADFKKGFVEAPPVDDNSADLVLCYFVLCNVPDVTAAVKGMKKVAKKGGTVCSIESVFSGGHSTDPRVRLIAEGHAANIDGAWVTRKELIPYPKEYPYGSYVYPSIFAQCGLRSIEVHALASSNYSRDRKWTEEETVNDAVEWLRLLGENRERYEANLKRAGWLQDRIEALFKAWNDYHKEILANPQKTLQEHNIWMKCDIVTIGQKE